MKHLPTPLFVVLITTAAIAQPLRIGKITIESVDVYSKDESRHGFFYQAANRLHIETRDSVVRKFLLFREGDEYRPERLQETERNLRAQHYLKSATVTAQPPHDGLVDVVVATQDAWSIAPETQAGNKGGASNYGASISDTNLFGYGKEAEVSWDKDVDRTRLGAHYIDPMLFDGYWNAQAGYGRTSDGNDQRLSIRRPFYSFSAPWSTELGIAGFRRHDKIYGDGVVSERFSHEMRSAVASWGWALDPSDDVANRIIGGVRLSRDRFMPLLRNEPFALPADREYRYLFARLEHAENRFVKLSFVNKDVRYEDFNIGRQYSIEGAVSPRLAGAPVNSAYASISIADGVQTGPTAFFLPSASLQSRFDGGIQNAVASGTLYVVKRAGDEHPSTFVGRARIDNAWRQDAEDQFFADGLNGLRGYRAHSFAGSRALIINAEQRFYLGRELLQLYSPGVVAFVDAGNATSGSFGDLMHLKLDAGVGIRIGLPRTPKNLLRIDLAYAFNRDPRGRKGLLLSFSSGQAF